VLGCRATFCWLDLELDFDLGLSKLTPACDTSIPAAAAAPTPPTPPPALFNLYLCYRIQTWYTPGGGGIKAFLNFFGST